LYSHRHRLAVAGPLLWASVLGVVVRVGALVLAVWSLLSSERGWLRLVAYAHRAQRCESQVPD
jgi:hypothetical protein